MAFFQYDGLSTPRWVGSLNFLLVYTDELFALSVQNSLALILLPVPLRVTGALLLALLMRRGGRLLNFFRSILFLPSVIPSAAYALAWLWILNPLFGPLNLFLQALGVTPPTWLADPLWAKPGLILASFWLIGEGFLVSLAALYDIPRELEDAARTDGANSFQLFSHVILPLIAPILLLLIFRDAILTFQESFVFAFLMTGGGPYYATYTLPYFVYEQSFDLLSFGTASAALWVMYALTGLIVIALYTIARQWGVATTEESMLL
jgi:multiple sugar transport system permease protein